MNGWLKQLDNAGQGRFALRCSLRRVVTAAIATLALTLLAAGCVKDVELKTDYGGRRGRAATSVNGVSVLADMFRETVARSTTVLSLSSALDKYDVVVWAPGGFTLPSKDARLFLDRWLQAESGRTFIFIGRDYDAAHDYWQAMAPQTPAEQRIDVMRRAAESQAIHSHRRIDMPEEECCEWFVMRRDLPGRRVRALSGPWSKGVDVAETRIWSQGRLDIPTRKELDKLWKGNPPPIYDDPDYTPLLVSGKETLVFEVTKPAWGSSKIIVVANGSFLLNLPLVNHQHRLLAGKLIDQCQPFSAVAFVESGPGGVSVFGSRNKEGEAARRARVLTAAHWFLLGIVCCFFAFPIFGRPKSTATESVADFGQHADAVAALLERTGDTGYARQQLDLFRKGQHLGTSRGSSTSDAAVSELRSPNSTDST